MLNNSNISFGGFMYGRMVSSSSSVVGHITKPLRCCDKGDYKVIKAMNNIFGEDINNVKIYFVDGLNSQVVLSVNKKNVEKHLKIPLWEHFFMQVTKYQNKFLNNKNMQNIIYKLNNNEYRTIKDSSILCSRKNEFKTFERHLKSVLPQEDIKWLDKNFF